MSLVANDTGWRWYYRFRGDFYAMGPTDERFESADACAEAVRQWWHLDDDATFEVWPTGTPRPHELIHGDIPDGRGYGEYA